MSNNNNEKSKVKSYNNTAGKLNSKIERMSSCIENEDEKNDFLEYMKGFQALFARFIEQKDLPPINWGKINPPAEGMVLKHENLEECNEEEKKNLLDKLVVLKLNGGLGTSMGCTGPKSVIEVRNNNTFLDLVVQQISILNEKYDASIPLVLMNSFNTETDTDKILHRYDHGNVEIHCFNQHRYPRISKETLMPVPNNPIGEKGQWYPPGHGDVFPAFQNSDVFQRLKEQGKEYVFISNIDNLGAIVDFSILKHMVNNDTEYIMEVTDKTRADVKGGTLIEYEGKIKLLEIAQVPPNKVEEFKSIKKFKIFNTNNLWVDINAIDRLIKEKAFDDMDVIVNNKAIGDTPVIQLERAAGAAIRYFNNPMGVNVPRSRFLPVKGCSDLLIVQSNIYELHEGSLIMSPHRPFPTVPLVKLGVSFKKVANFLGRFKTSPDILELDHLTVSGDVYFGSDVVLKGTVIIVANHGSRIDIPDGSVLENKVISGNLRILDH
eukprot:TRINITY_DN13578_c0_g1_i1.p1 TRINITY_DN13578_c0_g1~~TRINITY_DN13578_c0_g1_i1.p1  ORF type:complete len:492 (+),score=195.49 TRINITY_DN13578_c0_g1_i1:44-1519(+)